LETTQTVFKAALARLEAYVDENNPPDAVVISGDLTYKASDSGFKAFKDLLADHSYVWPDHSRIVVVPGNHDVIWKESPGTRERYSAFMDATRVIRQSYFDDPTPTASPRTRIARAGLHSGS